MTAKRVGGFILAAVLVLVGLLWTAQGLGMGSGGMSGKPIFIVIGLAVLALGAYVGLTVDRRTRSDTTG